jgi:hypothetical protein
MTDTRLLTVAQFSIAHPAFSQPALRHLIFDCENNGFRKAMKKIGAKILIDERAFFEWVTEQDKLSLNRLDKIK